MNISYQWLCDYLPQKITTEELADVLTRIGLEVEEVEEFSTIKGSLEGLVIGQVKQILPIPKSDKIRLTKVALREGSDEMLDIVCGAPNVVEQALVVVALPGTTIYPIQGAPMTIQQAKIRGVESSGMLCSLAEIGLAKEHSGIILLEKNVPLGTPASEVFPVYKDTVFKINLTANRSDAMSHFGVARDICAYWSYHQNQLIQPKSPLVRALPLVNQSADIQVELASNACTRYDVLTAESKTTPLTPSWMKHRLLAIGQSSIGGIVDATNYVLHDLGQPLHAFDRSAIDGNKLVVKQGLETFFVTLDGAERTLHKDDLMICNTKTAMCIAGVFGGMHSGITANTTSVVFESACFHAQTIRSTSMRHGLRTEAAIHFEKEIDVESVPLALQRLAFLLEEMGVTTGETILDIYPSPQKKRTLPFSLDRLQAIAGKTYDKEKVQRLFQSLDYHILPQTENVWTLDIPTFKSSIHTMEEIAEEVVRMDGLDAIPMKNELSFSFQKQDAFSQHRVQKVMASYLSGMGFYEVLHNSIVGSTSYDQDPKDIASGVLLKNSLSAKHDLMRPSMMESGLPTVVQNLNRKQHELKLFEFGKTYRYTANEQVEEKNKLGIWVSGDWTLADWNRKKSEPSTYAHIVGLVEVIARQCLISLDGREATTRHHFEQATDFFSSETPCAFAGKVDMSLLKSLGIKQAVWYAEWNIDFLLEHLRARPLVYQETSRFHDVLRDVAFFVDSKVTYHMVKSAVEALRLPNVANVSLFDRYQNDAQEKYSLCIRLRFRAYEKTLTEEACSKQVQQVMEMLVHRFSADIRKI